MMINLSKTSISNSRGFTLLELVTVMIIIGILAVAVLPRFFSSQGFEEYTYRDQAVTKLRAIQMRAMQQAGISESYGQCNEVMVDSTHLGTPDINPCTAGRNFGSTFGDRDEKGRISNELAIEAGHEVTFSTNKGSSIVFGFDRLGRPEGDCLGGCIISIAGDETLTVIIESQGYIHVGA